MIQMRAPCELETNSAHCWANDSYSVECGSCHDPHVESGTGTPASGQTFLRIANSGSAVCLACHNK